ncbi:FxSxx-COOH system tetratricopeptide repeat protein [Nocardia sp. NPDC051750]|uniref:FxSxx-COOH system tetratricopeptide repeat protein n=1 Tax=Nocardia sp. NPDC051750 TaxID=3364325 RepID=UPI0037961D74
MAHTPAEPAAAEPIIVAHAGEDAVWGMWLQQVGADAGLDIGLLRIDPGAGLPSAGPGRTVVLVISDSFMRATGATPEDWARYGTEPAGVLAVIVTTADVPPAAERIAAVDLRLLPSETAAQAKVLRAFGRPGSATTAPETLGRAGRMRVRYPNEQMFVDYQSKTLPQHQSDWFYGRETELAAIRDGLDKTGAAVLTGVAGSGKSWLAAAYVRRFRSQYDLIAWISGENGTVMRTELGQLAEPLGLPESPRRASRHNDVVAALRRTGKRYLLVYDNVTPDHHRSAREQLPLPRKPALLSEMVPWDGSGHVLLTSKVSDWGSPQQIRVPMFTVGEGADFLRRHVGDISEELARRFSTALDGSPVLLNALAHRGARGSEPVDEALLDQVQPAPFVVLNDELSRSYRRAASIFGDSLRPLLDEPVGSDAWAAGELLRLLACFAPGQSISMALLTSQLPGSERRAGVRLPEPLADALANEHRRRNVLDLAVRDSVAEICVDPLTERGRALRVHTVPWHGVRDFLPKDLAESNRHIAHQVLCDANPQRTDLPELWGRYLWLWQQIMHTEVLSCARVAQPGDPCAQLPELVRHVVAALRVQGELTAAAGLGLQAAQAWSKLLGETDIGVVRIRIVTGNTLWEMGDLERAREAAAEARDGVEQVRASYPEEYIWSSDLVAACLRMAGDWAAAVEFNEQSHAWALECLGEGNIETLRAAHNLAVSYRVMGRFADAMRIDSANYDRFQNDPMLADSSIMRLHCVNNVARNYRELGRAATSVVLQEQVLADFLKLLGSPRQQHVLRARKNLGVSYRKAGRYQEALETQRSVFANHLQVYGPTHPETLAAHTNVANDYRVLGDTEQALEHAETAYRRCADSYPAHPYTAACAVNYAAALRTAGRYREALVLDQEAGEIFTSRLSADHPYTLAARTGTASDLAGLDRTAEAAELGTDVLDRCRRIRGLDHPYTLQTAVNLALDLRTLGRVAEADALETDTLERYFETLGDDHPEYQAARARHRGVCDIEPPPM